ncbi:MAG: OmpA family protein [Saprospiraceae bacterium]
MSTGLIAILCIILIGVIAVQIGKVTELAGKIRGEEEVQQRTNNGNALFGMVFVVLFLILCVASAIYYQNWMLGYGPHESASEHGASLDYIFNVTLFFTSIVFFITQFALFWFAYKYRGQKGRKALYLSHDNKLEVVWTVIPAVVMTFLVVGGLDAWNEVMADVPEDAIVGEDYMEIEATGMQFAWLLRYPGADGKIGTKNYKKITGINPLGQDWTDTKNLDDFSPNEIVLPVGKPVRVRITSRDVLHNFDLPHFRVKMDAIPGLPTYFVFTPVKTTDEYRQALREYPEYQAPSDPEDPESDPLWKTFNYELACAELCGKGHYSMKRVVRIVEEDEYEDWLEGQTSYYMSTIRNTDEDPFKGQLLDVEIKERKRNFNAAVQKALSAEDAAGKVLRLDNVNFETGSANLTALSRYELDNLTDVMNKYGNMTIELAGHTDSTGDADKNMTLSQARADAVFAYLTDKGVAGERLTSTGYGQTDPVADNATDEGRAQNRRTEFKILTQ